MLIAFKIVLQAAQKKTFPKMKVNSANIQIFMAKIMKVVHPGEIYLAEKGHFELVEAMEKKISDLEPEFVMPTPGEYVVFRSSLRAQVLASLGKGNFSILLIDRDDIVEAHLSELTKLDSEFYKLHPATLKCSLMDVIPIAEDDQWTQEAADFVRQELKKKNRDYKVILCAKNQLGAYEVSITAITDTEQLVINGMLVTKGLAISTGPESMRDTIVAEKTESEVKNKKAETKEDDGRTKVQLLHIENPDEFYVISENWRPKFELMHTKIQTFARTKSYSDEQWARGDACLVLTKLPDCKLNWYRGIILDVVPEYRIVLMDYGAIITSAATNLLRMPEEFRQYRPSAIRCNMHNVLPTCGLTVWSQSSIDYLKLVKERFEVLGVSRCAPQTERSTPVVLWGVYMDDTNALQPERKHWININQKMYIEGFCMHSNDFTANLKMESFNLSDMCVPDCESAEFNSWKNKILRSLDYEDLPEEVVIEEQNARNEHKIGLIPKKIKAWLPEQENLKTFFVGKPTYVDNNCVIYIQDCDNLKLLEEMKLQINNFLKENPDLGKPTTFEEGEPCLAKFYDMFYYRAVILRTPETIQEKVCYKIQFIDFGNVEEAPVCNLLKLALATEIPALVNRYVLHGKWSLLLSKNIQKLIPKPTYRHSSPCWVGSVAD